MVVLLLFMVPEGFFLVSVAANYSGRWAVTLLHQGWKQASKKIQVPILSCTICDRGHRNNCCQEVFNAVAGIPDQEGITRTSGAKAKPPVFDHPSGGDGGAGRNYWPSFGRLSPEPRSAEPPAEALLSRANSVY